MIDPIHERLIDWISASPFIPHEHCYLWKPELMGLHVLADSLIAIAYYSIPLTLFHLVRRRRDLPFDSIFWLFGAFLVACGTSHLMNIWTLWVPNYWAAGIIKFITAFVSIYTAIALIPIIPKLLMLPNSQDLEASNRALQLEIAERQAVEAQLRQIQDQLEQRVSDRTTELARANATLTAEVADRQRAEAALRDMTQLQRAILDSANYTIISTTVDGTITTFNQAAERWLGYAAAEVVGKTTPAIIHDAQEVVSRAEDLTNELGFPIEPGFESFVAKARLGGPDEREWSYIRRDGSRFPVLLSVTALRDENQQITGFLGIGSDITERQRSDDALRHLSHALESAVEGISQLDLQGRYLAVNPAYATIIGYTPQELIGMEWPVTVHPDDLDKIMLAYEQMLAHGKVEVEARGVRKDGSLFDKQLTMVTAYDGDRQIVGHYCFMKDISDRREVERLKDEFISVVSHELRTPLTSISGALDLLVGGVLHAQPEQAQRMLTIAASNTDRLIRLINDILDIERIESGKITMTKQACSAASLLTQSAEVMRDMAERAGIQLHVITTEIEPMFLWADPDRIIQVLTNLLSNAIKFSTADSTIHLMAFPQSTGPGQLDQIVIQVQDQGRGIPIDKLDSIFERFQQVDASDSRQKGGTGLGLAICRSIVHHHQGQIWATSALGVGSTFFVQLPTISSVTAESRSLSVSPYQSPPEALRSPPLILECDDDPSVRSILQAILERQGYRVLIASSGQEAVRQAAQSHPDVIIINVMMPGLNGWETLAILKQQPETQAIPVIILSGLLPDPELAARSGVSSWLVKPPNPDQLRQALEKALAKPQQPLKVLIVEDDVDLAHILMAMFRRHGIETVHAVTGRHAIQLSQQVRPDLVVLDLGLPECDGFAVVDWLRQHNCLCQVPLVVYTARDINDRERQHLTLGETLFLTKGRISSQEFEQRVIALLNRMIPHVPEVTHQE